MTQSNENLAHILSQLGAATEINLGKLQEILPSCFILLDSDSITTNRIISVLTETWLSCSSVRKGEDLFLKELSTVVMEKIVCLINDVEKIMENASDFKFDKEAVQLKLTSCVCLLSSSEKILAHFSSFKQIDASVIPSLLISTNKIFLKIVEHLKNSETSYASLDESTLETLSSLFYKSNRVLISYSSFVTQKVHFNCTDEHVLKILIELLDQINLLAESVMMSFDLKMMGVQWKFFFKMMQTYAECLSNRFDVARPILYLINQVIMRVEAVLIKEITSFKEITKTLKICNFSLKIIINVCETFKNNLNSCYQNLVSLLCYLLGCSPPYLNFLKMPNEVICEVESLLSICSEPLLNLLINDERFIQEYFLVLNEIDSLKICKKLGYFLSTVTILRKLLSSKESAKSWIEPELNIIDVSFELMKSGHPELCLELYLPGEFYGDPSCTDISLYRSFMITLSAFIVGVVSEEDFPRIELTLLKNVCQQKIWPAMLASDIWCAISRYGSVELTFQHILVLINFILLWPDSKKFESEWVFISCLASRLYLLLSVDYRQKIIEKYPLSAENFSVWSALRIVAPSNHQIAAEILKCNTIEEFLNAKQPFDVALLSNLTAVLEVKAYSIKFYEISNKQDQFLKLVLLLWDCFSSEVPLKQFMNNADNSCGANRKLNKFLISLTSVTVNFIKDLNNSVLLKILTSLKNLCNVSSSVSKLCALEILRGISGKVIMEPMKKKDVIESIASLFQLVLLDSNHIVRQVSFETFKYFSTYTQHAQVVPLAVSKNQLLKASVSKYLTCTPEPLRYELGLEEFFKKQAEFYFFHKCSPISKTIASAYVPLTNEVLHPLMKEEEEASIAPPSKKFKSEDEPDLNMQIKVVETNLNRLLPHLKLKKINEEQRRALLSISNLIQSSLQDVAQV